MEEKRLWQSQLQKNILKFIKRKAAFKIFGIHPPKMWNVFSAPGGTT